MSLDQPPEISIVAPFYNEGPHVREVAETIKRGMEELSTSYEMVLVDDGSRDATWAVLAELAANDNSIHAIRLSRNFGKEAALSAGLAWARGRAVITMDGDLQHPPNLIPKMIELWRLGGWDIVEAVKHKANRGGFLKEKAADLFYGLQKRFTGMSLDGSSDFKLLDRRVVDAFNGLGERNVFFRGLCGWLGFRRTEIVFEVPPRIGGESKWPWSKLFKLGMTGIISFSAAPLQLTTFTGVCFLIFSILLGAHTLYMKLSGQAVSGFTTVILLLLIVGSAVMISLGIIGMYLAHIFDEVKNRPRYLVSETAGVKEDLEREWCYAATGRA